MDPVDSVLSALERHVLVPVHEGFQHWVHDQVHEPLVAFFIWTDEVSEEVVLSFYVDVIGQTFTVLGTVLRFLLPWTTVAETTWSADMLVPHGLRQ